MAALVAELGPPGEAPAPAAEQPAPRRAAPPERGGLHHAWEFGRAHAAVIGVIALVALVSAVWGISQARTVPVAVAAATPVAASPALGPTRSSTPAALPEPLRVHVIGAVARPGVVRVGPGARVEDAIAAAGGLLPEARPGELNLAAPVADGAQVVVGDTREPGGQVRGAEPAPAGGNAPPAGGSAAGRLDLNTASVEQLDTLPGVGPVTAQAIVAWRQAHQRFSRVEELLEVDGIGQKTFERIEPHVRV